MSSPPIREIRCPLLTGTQKHSLDPAPGGAQGPCAGLAWPFPVVTSAFGLPSDVAVWPGPFLFSAHHLYEAEVPRHESPI